MMNSADRWGWRHACLGALALFLFASSVRADNPSRTTAPDAQEIAKGSLDEFFPSRTTTESSEQLKRRIDKLIELLGHDQYAVRQRAQAELARIGVPAYDQLTAAQSNKDIEIAARARYLVNQIRIDWTDDSDSPLVKKILENYDFLDEAARFAKLAELAALPDELGIEPLSRLLRFERSSLLSRRCALLIMDQPSHSPKVLEQRQKIVDKTLEGSNRPAARLLRAYFRVRHDPDAALAEWNKHIDEEIAALDQSPGESQQAVMAAFQRHLVKLLTRLKDNHRAQEVMRKMVAMEIDDASSLTQTADWLIQQQAWDLVEELGTKFDRTFHSNPILLYSLAQARKMTGKDEEADKLALQASGLVAAGSAQHMIVASELQERGLFDWAEREYKRFLSGPVEDVQYMVTARILFAEMLHDMERPLDAAEVLQKLSDAMARDRQVLQAVQHSGGDLNRKPGSIRSRMHYFYALHYESQKNVAAQRKHLEEGIAQDKTDADVLIAMYRMSKDDPEFRKKTMKLIAAAEQQFRREIESAPERENGYNQYAWLIGNTEGDIDLAIKYSHRSLELRPETAGYLDTLAHCYAAKGDYENAVRYQSQAVELDPHTRQIKKALERFKTELEKKRAT